MKPCFVFIATLCVVLMATLAMGQSGSVSMSWESDFLINGLGDTAPALNVLFISLKQVPLTTATFRPAITEEQADLDPFTTTYEFSAPSDDYLTFFQNSIHGCVDAETGQAVVEAQGIHESDSTDTSWEGDIVGFKFKPLAEFALRFPEGKYTVDLLCPISVRNTDFPQSTLIDINWQDGTTTTSVELDLPFPTMGFVEPLIDFKSLKIGSQSKALYSSTTFDIEFTTDIPGVYKVESVNGLPLIAEYSLTDQHEHIFYCSAGTDKKFAIMNHDKIYITKATTDTIKCRFYSLPDVDMIKDPAQYVANKGFIPTERISVNLSLVDSPFKVSLTSNFDLKPGTVMGELEVTSSTNNLETVNFDFTAITFMSSTPININSTIEINFSNLLDVSHLSLTSGPLPTDPNEYAYRGFKCTDGSTTDVFVTVVVNTGANKITLKDVSTAAICLQCQFTFAGAGVLRFDQQARQASFSVKVDGNALTALHAPGKTEQPLQFRTKVNIRPLEDFIEIIPGTEGITVVNSFIVEDLYSTYFTTLGKPVILFSLTGVEEFPEEERNMHFACQQSRPSSTGFEEMDLTFDHDFGFWKFELKNIQNLETFHIKIVCERNLHTLTKFGRNITPFATLNVDVVDFIDEHRYSSVTSHSFVTTLRDNLSQTQSYPGNTIAYADLSASLVIPQGKLTTEVKQTAQDAFQKLVNDQIKTTTALTKYTPQFFRVADVSLGKTYYSLTAAYEYYNYIVESLGWAIEMISLTASAFPIDNLTTLNDERVALPIDDAITHSLKQSTIKVTSFYTTTLTQDEWEEQETDLGNVDFSEDVYTPTAPGKMDRFTEVILAPMSEQTLKPNYSFRSPITECGYDAGAYVTADEIGFSYAPTSTTDAKQAWQNFLKIPIQHHLCEVGESCSINADCITGSCRKGLCTVDQKFDYPFVHWQHVIAYGNRDFFNSGLIATSIGAMVIAAIAIIF